MLRHERDNIMSVILSVRFNPLHVNVSILVTLVCLIYKISENFLYFRSLGVCFTYII